MLVRRSKTKKIVEWMLERPARVIVASFLFIMAIYIIVFFFNDILCFYKIFFRNNRLMIISN